MHSVYSVAEKDEKNEKDNQTTSIPTPKSFSSYIFQCLNIFVMLTHRCCKKKNPIGIEEQEIQTTPVSQMDIMEQRIKKK